MTAKVRRKLSGGAPDTVSQLQLPQPSSSIKEVAKPNQEGLGWRLTASDSLHHQISHKQDDHYEKAGKD